MTTTVKLFGAEVAADTLKLCATLVVFTTAYCIQPLLVDSLKYQGAASPSTLLYLMPHYASMVLVGFFPSALRAASSCEAWKKAAFVSIIDIAHQMAEKAGLVFAGSGVYIVAGSSSIVWTAIISAFLLRHHYSTLQWLSLLTICLGLGIKATSIDIRLDNDECLGMMLTIGSAILHGLTFVTNEKFLTAKKEALSGPGLVFMMGVMNSMLLLLWTAVWTLPRYDELVVASIERHGGNYRTIGLLAAGLFACGFVHSCTLWYLLKCIGAVSSGVIKGLKTASVFLLSHYLFCEIQTSQCLTPLKASSAAVCVLGVLSYSLVSYQRSSSAHHGPKEEEPLLSPSIKKFKHYSTLNSIDERAETDARLRRVCVLANKERWREEVREKRHSEDTRIDVHESLHDDIKKAHTTTDEEAAGEVDDDVINDQGEVDDDDDDDDVINDKGEQGGSHKVKVDETLAKVEEEEARRGRNGRRSGRKSSLKVKHDIEKPEPSAYAGRHSD